ncbi:MAG: type I restriction endonuclease, partial [Bacteroidota bacterium]
MAFNENTRVKIPAMLHLCILGYKYVSLSKAKWNIDTNYFTEIFEESIQLINPKLEQNNIKRLLEDISLILDNEEKGESLYKMLVSTSGRKLIDFKNFNNNSFHVVTELNRKNNLLKAKYENDAKNARMNKRILKKGKISIRESEICETLMG